MTSKQKESFLESKLPNLPQKATDHKAIEYVGMIYQGIDKYDSFKIVFPERHQRIHDKAIRDNKNPRFAVLNDIGAYESGKYVQELYELTQEHYWSHFIDKRTLLLNRLADKGMNDELAEKDQLNAIKIFLSAVPDMKKDEKLVVEHRIADDPKIISQLKRTQELIYLVASEEDIIEAEIDGSI